MAASIYDWSLTAASNSNSDADIAWPEGQAPSTVNNSARAMMQRVKELLVDIGGSLAAGGTANGLTVTAESPFSAYADGQLIAFRATATNTGAATLSVNGVGAKAIRKFNASGEVALVAGDIKNTGIYVAYYSAALNAAAGGWMLSNPVFSGNAMTAQDFLASATWTKPSGCTHIIGEGVGGGGGGGGVDGQGAGTVASAGGGGAGFAGRTAIIDVTAVSSASITIGSGGAGGVAGNNAGSTGGSSLFIIGATTYQWKGGIGGSGNLAFSTNLVMSPGGGVASGSLNVIGGGSYGETGFTGAGAICLGGAGGSSPFGHGGDRSFLNASGTASGNAPDAGCRGAGGSGASVSSVTSNVAGGAGSDGYIRIWELYG